MTFTLKTEFADLPEALQYLTTEVQAELTRLTTAADAFEAEKRRILANRDELLNEAKQAKERARQAEDAAKQIEAELALVKSQASGETSNDLEAKFAQVRSKLELDFAKKMEALEAERAAIEAEREAEKAAAAQARLRELAIAELSKPEYGVINPSHFLKLHGDRFAMDDDGGLYIDLGDFNRQTPAQFVQDLASRPSEAYLFKPKGGSGNGSTGSGGGSGAGSNVPNPFKTGNLTEQMQLYKTNQALYNRLKQEAGT